MKIEGDSFANYLVRSGTYVVNVDGVDWYEYNGFMMPAYLPHCTPEISRSNAKKALQISGRLFVRWISDYGTTSCRSWWHVIRHGAYSLKDCSANTRSKISRGLKQLEVRIISCDEVLANGYDLCKKAVARYDSDAFMPERKVFECRVEAARGLPDVIEYCGVFFDGKLVGLSENIVQDGAVFWESIWYDPEYLGKYSSYALTHFMLDLYLNDRKMSYVSDGSRSIYHETNVQKFFIDKFNFKMEYSKLHVSYSNIMKIIIFFIYPFRRPLFLLNEKLNSDFLKKLAGLVNQEVILRAS